MAKSRGMSYRKRVEDINRIYDRHARSGLSDMPSLFDFMGDNPENQESDERP